MCNRMIETLVQISQAVEQTVSEESSPMQYALAIASLGYSLIFTRNRRLAAEI